MKGKSKEAVVHEKQLSLPDVASIDHTKTCPRYTSSNFEQEFNQN
jgi:hypothetical protein